MTEENRELSGNQETPVIVLFRQDLRTSDNRALSAAARTGRPVVPAFVLEHTGSANRPLGRARQWWLHQSLSALSDRLEQLGSPLVLLSGNPDAVLGKLLQQTGADTVFWNLRYDPQGMAADRKLKVQLSRTSIKNQAFEGHLLHEPARLTTATGSPFRVYTPFWRALLRGDEPRAPLAAPKWLLPFENAPKGEALQSLNLKPAGYDRNGGLSEMWKPGEDRAIEKLNAFLTEDLDTYLFGRDLPATSSTSMLSPHLAHGEITPFQIWHASKSAFQDARAANAEKFRKEIAWREFSYHLLFHNPQLGTANFNRNFDRFPWSDDMRLLECWQRGETGYPLVDAGMRQLWQTGWMHNRVRMVCASFLVKHLMIDWRHGENWFWDTLVDADPASNAASWQWVAGCGADAAPYFRIFNPILQGEKFDSEGTYIRRFVPELRHLSNRFVHKPWQAPESELQAAGLKIGKHYPKPVVGHQLARNRALEAYQSMRGAA